MSDDIYADYPPALSSEAEAYLVQTVKDWTIEHGLTVRPSKTIAPEHINKNECLATNAPVTLFPSPFPKACFDQARKLQQAYNELYAAIANDADWLEGIVTELVDVDDFIGSLWKVHLAVKEEGYVQPISLGMFRSDYMLHTADEGQPPSLKQVEFNTISSSFGGLAERVTQLHTELATFPAPTQSLAYPPHALFNSSQAESQHIKSDGIPPPNHAVETLCASLAAAHTAYGQSKSLPSLPLCILFLVQDHERNLFDQLALSSHLHHTHHITTFRITPSQILTHTSIPSTNPSRPLLYTPFPTTNTSLTYETTTIYFRALYSPTEFTSASIWTARQHLERSAAIKCPSILLHLSGSKKVQQVLTATDTDHLRHFLPSQPPSTLSSLRTTFAPQYALTDATGLSLAINPSTAQSHVLKPQREGGGNNIYKSSIPPFLATLPKQQRNAYILMELIRPPPNARNTVLRSDGSTVSGNVISELGIFGTCLWKRNEDGRGMTILQNEEGGYLLRTKGKDSDEGGVAAGFSSLDSLILYGEV